MTKQTIMMIQGILIALGFICIEIAIYLKWSNWITLLLIIAFNSFMVVAVLELVSRSQRDAQREWE